MRSILGVMAFAIATVQLPTAQSRFPGEVYRGPHFVSREATFVEPASGAPLEFSKSSLRTDDVLTRADYVLTTVVRSKSLRAIPASVITLRLAFGPTTHGMITFRMRAVDHAPEPPIRITPDSPPALLTFRIAAEDPYPGVLALKPQAKVVFTVERIDGDIGVPMFENPDATELLWEALGRPTAGRQP